MAELDCVLKQHIERSENRVFLGLSKTFQNELLESIDEVCLNLIRSEVSKANFLAIEVDETTDCANLSELVLITYYELLGQINERFISFVRPKSHSADDVTAAVLCELEKMNVHETPEKLTAQCYDGAPVMSGHESGVQTRIREMYSNAHFIHCYAHQLNLIVERCVAGNKQVRIFFSSLEEISTFFSRSSSRTAILDEAVKKRIPTCPQSIRWNFKSRSVTTVYKYQKEVVECLERIIDDDASDYKTINKATRLKGFLQDEDFLFWLNFFNTIMPHCDILFNQLQQRNIDAVKTVEYVSHFADSVQQIRTSLETDDHWEQVEPTENGEISENQE
ncbi:zinc finger MYM-type protein 1-like [Schistocerca nitens]|uniref:zinc finger MYM-type protein 1-like n=1 Tax=Schistocerca nitens TaxID=7011 RepID=UPI002117D288|nr:zinc finger MYM-type protein 1-like [Schistocerca nitens]